MVLELTFVILKPHVLKVPFVSKEIKDIILKNGFLIIRSKEKTLSPIDLQRFYGEHEKKFFYNRLISFMSSGPIEALILARENAILKWRELMGPTRVFEAQFSAPDTIRGKYGLTDTRNATHGSDSTESAQREMSILFPDFDPVLWLKVNESHFKAEGEQISGKDFHSVIK
ncbi:nucleoside diphosphate kinase 6 isoform X2 [Nilaparvata lugens]|uniref:nucleoside diphosphate kinase 6 isoform X2 n=1 Tax=Nilaparvata lugens TaxID=108931 RepID=UPI00193CAE7D|nr:nucleoside diphosphate kinase 6 isoform X2 [Nilaparvata lugens]